MSSIEEGDALAAKAQKSPHRVSLESIQEKISQIEFHHPHLCPHMTVAYVQMDNGFVVIGESAPADPENFDRALGEKFAVENAIRKIWPLEGYVLCERMAEEA